MPELPFPLTATESAEMLQQMQLLMDELFQERVGGANLGDVFIIGDDDILSLSLSSTGGLQKSSNQVAIKVLSTGGILVNATGIQILINSTSGLETDASGLAVKLKTSGGLSKDANGLYVTSGFDGFPDATELTIASGEITVTTTFSFRFHSIDTESDAASDDLDTINGGNAGELLLLQAEDDARTVVCKDGASLKLQADFSLDNAEDKILLICISSGVWHEISRASNGA